MKTNITTFQLFFVFFAFILSACSNYERKQISKLKIEYETTNFVHLEQDTSKHVDATVVYDVPNIAFQHRRLILIGGKVSELTPANVCVYFSDGDSMTIDVDQYKVLSNYIGDSVYVETFPTNLIRTSKK